MSADEIARKLNETTEERPSGVWGLILAIALKYGLPSLTCIWLFYVIWCKDIQIFKMAQDTTTALVESNHARSEQTAAIKELAEAVKGLK